MRKPLTFCLFTTLMLIAFAACGSLRFLAVGPTAYSLLQLILAAVCLGTLCVYGRHRLSTGYGPTAPLLAGVVSGSLSCALSSANSEASGAGGLFASIGLAALVLNGLFALYAFGELDKDSRPSSSGDKP